MRSCMVDVKLGGWTQKWDNDELHLMLGGRTRQVNYQDQTVQSGNCCCSSIRGVSVDDAYPAIMFVWLVFFTRLRVLLFKKTWSRQCQVRRF